MQRMPQETSQRNFKEALISKMKKCSNLIIRYKFELLYNNFKIFLLLITIYILLIFNIQMSKLSNESCHVAQEQASFKFSAGTTLFKSYLEMPIWQLRHLQVSKYVEMYSIKNILDIGCAEGTLINRLSRSCDIQHLIGIDLDINVLDKAKDIVSPQMLQDDVAFQRQNPLQVELFQLNVLENLPFEKFQDIELVTMIQFIEHLKQEDLPKLCQQIFQKIQPKFIIITTPNQQFNVHFNFKPGQMRHPQHLFEWTREKFNEFCAKIAKDYQYTYEIFGVGEHITSTKEGFCSQGAFFAKIQPKPKEKLRINSNVKPYFHVRYPFWKDRIAVLVQNEIRNQIIQNNYENPDKILTRFKRTKIGKRMQKHIEDTNANTIAEIPQTITKQWIIEIAKTIQYCGYHEERDYLYYEYESTSMDEELEQFERNYERERKLLKNECE